MGTIVGSTIFLCLCIRLCIQLCCKKTQSLPSSGQREGPIQVQVHSYENNLTTVPAYNIREEAPPSYTAATSSITGQLKY